MKPTTHFSLSVSFSGSESETSGWAKLKRNGGSFKGESGPGRCRRTSERVTCRPLRISYTKTTLPRFVPECPIDSACGRKKYGPSDLHRKGCRLSLQYAVYVSLYISCGVSRTYAFGSRTRGLRSIHLRSRPIQKAFESVIPFIIENS